PAARHDAGPHVPGHGGRVGAGHAAAGQVGREGRARAGNPRGQARPPRAAHLPFSYLPASAGAAAAGTSGITGLAWRAAFSKSPATALLNPLGSRYLRSVALTWSALSACSCRSMSADQAKVRP